MYKKRIGFTSCCIGSPAYAVTSEIAAEGEIVNATRWEVIRTIWSLPRRG